MTALANIEVLDDDAEFFAPVSSDVIDRLVGEYQQRRKQIDDVVAIVNGDLGNVIHYFIEGNSRDDRNYSAPSVAGLFDRDGAIFSLNSSYWSKAMLLTDVYDLMPQARRDYWNAQLKGHKTVSVGHRTEKVAPLPDFEEATVRATLSDLLGMRAKFFAERIDGIFRGLSGEHVTNVPEGFSKRMIIGYMLSYGSIRYEKAGLINDLRCVIAKFMGRDEPKYLASDVAIRQMYNRTGQWNVLDGGSLKVRVYKKGTAHLEVHPDIAWRLNQMLAHLYPTAIPAQFRAKPPKKTKRFEMMQRPLPFAVLNILAADQRYTRDDKLFRFDPSDKGNSAAYNEALRILLSIGGVLNKDGMVQFDYHYREVLQEIIVTGSIPDKVSHQFYPTPESIALAAAEMAEIGDDDTVLEPSAGQGDLASFLPKERTTCVEISALHCDILKARGFNVIKADFLEWALAASPVDKVVMNPPFSEGRAKAHVEAAASLVKPGGRVVAVLPASMRNKDFLPGFNTSWSQIFTGEFSGTSVSVAIMCAQRVAA